MKYIISKFFKYVFSCHTFARSIKIEPMKRIYSILLAGLSFMLLISCGHNKESQRDGSEDNARDFSKGQSLVVDEVSQKNILQIAISSKDHSTLVAGVQATGLEDVLANNGPLTVFAPTNAAFDKLPPGTLENLLKPENLNTLKTIITYHAAPGTYKGDLLKNGQKLFVATGDYLTVERDGDVVRVNGSEILATIDASNGVIHVVNDVFLPPNQ